MRWILIACLAVFIGSILAVSLMAGAGEPDPRTFVFVRAKWENVVGADVVFLRMSDHERWIFPKTGPGGWCHRQVPDGHYLVSVKADGYVSKIMRVTVPDGNKFPYRTFTIWVERAK